MDEVLEMSSKERDLYRVLNRVAEGKLTQIQAAELLSITDRQVRNRVDCMKALGARGLISRKRGRLSNRRLPQSLKHRENNGRDQWFDSTRKEGSSRILQASQI